MNEKSLGADAAAVVIAGQEVSDAAPHVATAGPWRVVSDFVGPFRIVTAKDATVAVAGHTNSSEAMANAELIAAAPELLEALKALMARIPDIAAIRREGITGAAYSVYTASFNETITDEFVAAEAAIAKAEGRS